MLCYYHLSVKPVVIAVSNSSVSAYEGNTTSLVCFATAIPRPDIVWANNNDLHIGGRIQSIEGMNFYITSLCDSAHCDCPSTV